MGPSASRTRASRATRTYRAAAAVVFSAATLCSATAEPSEPADFGKPDHRLTWRDEWPEFRPIEYGLTAALLIELSFVEFGMNEVDRPRYAGGVLFDDGVRNVTRLPARSGREAAATASDVTRMVPLVQAVAVDGLLVPLLLDDGNAHVAWQLTAMNVMSMATVGVFNRTNHRVVGRARPNEPECRSADADDPYCGRLYESFPAGHPSGAFLGAGMACAHHTYLPLYGGGVPDAVFGCGLPLSLSAATGALRLMADQHYATDVLVGSGLGFLGGFGLPIALHYGIDSKPTTMVVPHAASDMGGAAVVGAF